MLSFDHTTAVYDADPRRLRFMYNTERLTTIEEIEAFKPELVINAVTLKYTLDVFREITPHLPADCILSDIASVKTGLHEYYASCGHRYVSTHPMFGPTFANLGALSNENAIIITEGDYMGRIFFKDLYTRLGLHICEYSFEEHDETVAYSLGIPFVSTFVFAAVMKHQDAPGTTFKRHMAIAKGVFGRRCLPLARNSLQPPHVGTSGENPQRTGHAHRHYRPQRRGRSERLPRQNTRTHQITAEGSSRR